MTRGVVALEVLAVVALALLGFAAGRHAFESAPRQTFYQPAFGPAVMVALGRGFINPQPVEGGALEAFLTRRTDTLAAGAVDVAAVVDVDQFQVSHRYLMTAVGWWWGLTSISWSELAAIAGFAYALASVSMFALLRLFVPVAPAAIGALWLASSPLLLGFAPHVRDFAKGAFVLAATPFAVALVMRPMSERVLALVGAAAGVLIGVGLGFKMDVSIMAPITVMCVVLFRGARPWSAIREKAIVVGALVLALAITAWPILSRLSAGGSNAIHVVLLGYSDWFDPRLRIEPASYSFIPFYSDAYLRNLLRARAWDQSGSTAIMPSPAYDTASGELWRQFMRHFPADVYTRLLAAVDGVLNLGFHYPAPLEIKGWWPTEWLTPAFERLGRWFGWGWLLGVGIVVAAARDGAVRSLFFTVLVMALAGYPSLQYDLRHFFQLQAIPIAAMVVIGWGLSASAVRRLRRQPLATTPVLAPIRRLAVAAAVMAGVLLPTAGLRAYQERHLATVFAAVTEEPRQRLDVVFEPLGADRFVGRWPDVEGEPNGVPGLRRAYYVAEFSADEPRAVMAIGLRYSEAPDWSPCALARRLQTANGVARFAFPVFSLEREAKFDGIELGAEMRRRFLGLYRLPAGPAGLPIGLHLASDWRDRRLYQRLIREERLQADDTGVDLISPAVERCGSDLRLIDATLSPALVPTAVQVAKVHSKDVHVGAQGISVDGAANDEPALLAELAARAMQPGDAVVARLWLDRGSIMVALVKDGIWVRNVAATRPGASVVILRATDPGDYSVLITSRDPGMRRALAFTIDRLGIVSAAAEAPSRP